MGSSPINLTVSDQTQSTYDDLFAQVCVTLGGTRVLYRLCRFAAADRWLVGDGFPRIAAACNGGERLEAYSRSRPPSLLHVVPDQPASHAAPASRIAMVPGSGVAASPTADDPAVRPKLLSTMVRSLMSTRPSRLASPKSGALPAMA